MKIELQFALAALVLGAAPHVHAQDPNCKRSDTPECKAQREASCRKAIAEFTEIVRSTPITDAREKVRHAEFKAKVEGRIADNRRKGVEECTTWGEVGGLASRQ
ncbi:MAG: hypothetical protein ABIQ72_03975 [Usitatibacter sp.]